MPTQPRALLAFLRRHDTGVKAVALGLRGVILDEMAPCHEYIFAMRNAVMLLYGPTARVIEDCICMIGVHRNHVNLTFAQGAEIDDSFRALQGTGKRMRHIQLKRVADLEQPAIRAYLRQARAIEGLAPRGPDGGAVVTVVKQRSKKERVDA